MVHERVPRRFHVVAVAALALGAGAFVPDGVCRADDSDFFSADLELAPLKFDGRFPTTIQAADGVVSGNLVVDCDVRGRLRGALYVNDLALALGGTATHAAGKLHVVFGASTLGAKIKFVGDVADGSTSMTGTATGKGFLAAGKSPFTIDLSSAGPETATVEYTAAQDAKGRITGRAHVLCCGEDVPLKASGKGAATSMTLTLASGKDFVFKGTGAPPGTSGGVTLNWTAKGFGAASTGSALVFVSAAPPDPLAYGSVPSEFETDLPISPVIPTSGSAPRGKFTISPTPPAGMAFDSATGILSGTPTEVRANRPYTVTAANFGGSQTATFNFSTRVQRARSFARETRFLSDADYRHFLGRAEFGVRQLGGGQTTLDKVKSEGLDKFVDDMLVFNQNGPAEAIAAPELVNASDPATLKGKFPSQTQLARWWSSLLMNTDNPFQERLAFFWANHFAVSSDALEVGESHFMQEYVNLFRYGGNGNLKTLLLSMARSGAMLKYLNGNTNSAQNINENFAREFWELFTLGVDNGYTQSDIVQGAHAFTGYKFVTDPTTHLVSAVFDPTLHDSGQKSVLGYVINGQAVQDDYDSMVQSTLDHGQVAEFVTTRIFEHFGFPSPHPSLVADMAAALRASNYELAPFLKQLFLSEAFFSDTARAALVKSPVDYAVGFVESTGLKVTTAQFQSLLATLGQSPTEPPSVKGWPIGTLWFSAQNMADRANLLDACVSDTTRQTSVGINVAAILPPVAQRTPGAVVDQIAALFDLTLVTDERQLLIDFLNTPTPFDGSSQTMLDDRVRGLLYVMAQHPQYELR